MTGSVATERDTAVAAYLKRPYARIVVPESDGTFRSEVLEFPGCLAVGETPIEALSAIEDAAWNWLHAAIEVGQNIPDPVESTEFSGRFVLRIPRSLHKKAARLAEYDRVSLNQFITTALAEYVGERAPQYRQIIFNATVTNVNTQVFIGEGDKYTLPDLPRASFPYVHQDLLTSQIRRRG